MKAAYLGCAKLVSKRLDLAARGSTCRPSTGQLRHSGAASRPLLPDGSDPGSTMNEGRETRTLHFSREKRPAWRGEARLPAALSATGGNQLPPGAVCSWHIHLDLPCPSGLFPRRNGIPPIHLSQMQGFMDMRRTSTWPGHVLALMAALQRNGGITWHSERESSSS